MYWMVLHAVNISSNIHCGVTPWLQWPPTKKEYWPFLHFSASSISHDFLFDIT